MNPTVDESPVALLLLLSLLITVALYVWTALALSAMFRKMGEQPWKGWVPVLNIATVLRWGGFSPWLVLLLLVPGAGGLVVYVLLVVAAHRLGPGFGYGTGMTVVAAVLFPVWATILGFGPSRWLGARPATALPANGVARRASTEAPTAAAADLPAESPPAPSSQDAVGDPFAAFAPPSAAAEPAASSAPQTAPNPIAHDTDAAVPAGSASWAPPAPPSPSEAAVAPQVAPAPEPTGDDAWPSVPDEVSAVAPAPFPPSSAAAPASRHVAPPVEAGDPLVSFVPGRRTSMPNRNEEVSVTRVPPRPAAPVSDEQSATSDADAFPEMSGEVSAVVGSPAAGSPRSARASVAAQQRDREPTADEDDDAEMTVIARRRRPAWQLMPAQGSPIPLTADVVILGRRPASDAGFPRAQLVPLDDHTRTVSKTHARLEHRGDGWWITDLHSTNGVLLPTYLGSEVEAEPGTAVPAGDRFLLGDAEFRLARTDD